MPYCVIFAAAQTKILSLCHKLEHNLSATKRKAREVAKLSRRSGVEDVVGGKSVIHVALQVEANKKFKFSFESNLYSFCEQFDF